jgi:hypothetical protein
MSVEIEIEHLKTAVEALQNRVVALEGKVNEDNPVIPPCPMKIDEFRNIFGTKAGNGKTRPMAYATLRKMIEKGDVTVETMLGRRYVVDYIGRKA